MPNDGLNIRAVALASGLPGRSGRAPIIGRGAQEGILRFVTDLAPRKARRGVLTETDLANLVKEGHVTMLVGKVEVRAGDAAFYVKLDDFIKVVGDVIDVQSELSGFSHDTLPDGTFVAFGPPSEIENIRLRWTKRVREKLDRLGPAAILKTVDTPADGEIRSAVQMERLAEAGLSLTSPSTPEAYQLLLRKAAALDLQFKSTQIQRLHSLRVERHFRVDWTTFERSFAAVEGTWGRRVMRKAEIRYSHRLRQEAERHADV